MTTAPAPGEALRRALDAHRPASAVEAADLARARALAATDGPWRRDAPLHVTASALVVHPPSGRVLLRWHDRLERWLHVGGHADPGEDDPWRVAWREAREETGLDDLVTWPGPASAAAAPPTAAVPALVQVAVVAVPAVGAEPAHEHVDLRYVMATDRPGAARAESARTRLRWCTLPEAAAALGADDLVAALDRVGDLLAGRSSGGSPTAG